MAGLAPSTYEAALSFYLNTGYPLGSFLPWGVGHSLVGQDLLWVFQPYEAFIAAMERSLLPRDPLRSDHVQSHQLGEYCIGRQSGDETDSDREQDGSM